MILLSNLLNSRGQDDVECPQFGSNPSVVEPPNVQIKVFSFLFKIFELSLLTSSGVIANFNSDKSIILNEKVLSIPYKNTLVLNVNKKINTPYKLIQLKKML